MPVRRIEPPPPSPGITAGVGASLAPTLTPPAGTASGPRSIGDLVILSATFSDPSSTTPPVDPVSGFSLINPSPAPVCTIRQPDGVELVLQVTVSGTIYMAEVVASQAGTWWYRFATPSGAFQGVGEGFFQVRRRRS